MSASAAGALVGSSPSTHDLLRFLHGPRLRFDLRHSRRRGISSRISLRSVREQRAAATVAPREEDKEVALVNGYGLNGNGSLPGFEALKRSGNGNLDAYMNGNGAGNLSLVKYPGGTDEAVQELGDESAERKRRSRVEDIGKEDAWFKNSQENRVSVAPGGRWNRIKTYSTIQRTLEIWGFVFAFIFKAWLNNRKFSYRGGMTEEKKLMRRKTLAKWLKESILRLGPTFIKIGQQFSTRVDILAQEYVDQLSELQV